MTSYADLAEKTQLLEELSYQKYNSYSFVCGIYSGILKDLITETITKSQAEKLLDDLIKKYQAENNNG